VILGVSSDTIGRMIEAGELRLWRKLPGPNGDRLLSRAAVERAATKRAAELQRLNATPQ
jgi:excisionase family DNA binding protein